MYSIVNSGTTFKLFLPEAVDKEKYEDRISEYSIEYGDGSVMIIDDEHIARETARGILEECGYDVTIAESGMEGINLLLDNKNKFKVVLLDIAMPRMSGKEVFRELRRINPFIKIILQSGFRYDTRITDLLGEKNVSFISKPYSLYDLSKLVKNFINN